MSVYVFNKIFKIFRYFGKYSWPDLAQLESNIALTAYLYVPQTCDTIGHYLTASVFLRLVLDTDIFFLLSSTHRVIIDNTPAAPTGCRSIAQYFCVILRVHYQDGNIHLHEHNEPRSLKRSTIRLQYTEEGQTERKTADTLKFTPSAHGVLLNHPSIMIQPADCEP